MTGNQLLAAVKQHLGPRKIWDTHRISSLL